MFARAALSIVLSMGIAFSASADPIKIKYGYANPANSHFGVAGDTFAKEVARLSNGRFEVEQFPASALGGEREMLEAIQLGTLEIMLSGNGPLANFVPEAGIIDIPFLFRDTPHMRAVLQGPIGQELLDKMTERGLVGLAWGENGFRHITNNKHPVKTPEDLRGLKIRTLENNTHLLAFRTLGASPTPMSFPELYGALEQGAVDGQENPISVMVTSKLYQVQKYMSLTGHFYTATVQIASPSFWNSLTPADQALIQQAVIAARDAQRDEIERIEQQGIAQMQKEGLQVVSDIDKEAFEQALQPAYETYAKQFGQGAIDRIRAVK